MTGPALVVMARAPVPGWTKTRLQPELTAAQCAALSLALLEDAIELAAALPRYTPFLTFTPNKERQCFETLTRGRIELIPQIGGDLGQRMYHIMSALEAREYSPVVIIGIDIPTLQPDTLLRAIAELKHTDLCLGPSRDGGYYLIGARRSDDRIFNDIVWSTPHVLNDTTHKAKESGLSFALLEEYSDIDTFADLKQLNIDLTSLRTLPGVKVPKATEGWLNRNRCLFA